MEPNRWQWKAPWTCRLGEAIFLALVGLVVVAIFLKGPWPSDTVYLLVRWPIWVSVLVGLPLLVWRILWWHRHPPYRG